MRSKGLVAVLVAACGGGGGGGGAMPDAVVGVDAHGDSEPIDVAVYSDNRDGYLPSVVYFIAPDGTTQKVALDVYGHAKAMSPANSWVVVAHFENQITRRVDAYGGIGPGMKVSDFPPPEIQTALSPKPTLTVPRFTGAQTYAVLSSCNGDGGIADSGQPAIALDVQALDCALKTDANIVVTAFDASQTALGYSWLQHADLTHDATMPAMQPATTRSLAFQHLPFAPTQAGTRAQLTRYQGSDPSMLASAQASAAIGSDAVTFSVTISPVGDRTGANATLGGPDITATFTGTVSGDSVDGATLPRLPHDRAFDPATNTLTWQESATGTSPQLVARLTKWSTATSDGTLFAYAPYTGPSLVLPRFPAELGVVLDGANLQVDERDLITMDASYAQIVSEGFYGPPATWRVSF